MAQIYSNLPTEQQEVTEQQRDEGYYNYKGMNQPAMMCAIGVILLGLLVFMTAAFLPFGLLIMVVGGIWALVILALGRRTPEGNHRL